MTRIPALFLATAVVAVVAMPTALPTPALAADSAATPPEAASKFPETLATSALLEKLRKGGFVLYLRHTKTDNAKPDRVPAVDLDDCNTQRPITEEGRQLAVRVGNFIRQARIPFQSLHISPLCRVKDTVAAAFPGRQPAIDNNLMYVANLTREQKAPIIARTRSLLSEPVADGTNRLVVAHAPNLMELIGYFPKEATLVIFRPRSGDPGFDYVASIPPEYWTELLR